MNDNSDWFIIKDLTEFTDKARAIVYNNFGSWDDKSEIDVMIDTIKDGEQEELDRLLSHSEALVIVKQTAKKQHHKHSKKVRYILSDELFVSIIENLNSRLISNVLNSLVQKGLVESGYDNETNDFVFWVKKDENKEEKPETD